MTNEIEHEIEIGQDAVRKRRAELAKNRKPIVIPELPEPEPNSFDLGDLDNVNGTDSQS